jgi:hypothetical protein
MIMKAITTKKNSTAKKLVPAAGSLLISAAMLGTSTFAWFTMSREVEVKNIKMTATVPEDIQISLGHLVNFSATATGDANVSNAPTFTGLAGNQGILKGAGDGTADDGNVQAPLNGTDAVSALDWASSADISEYYRLGKIIPASSTTGENIYFTPDAAGVGKTLKAGARYYQAADLSGALMEAASTGRTPDGTNPDGSLKTTLHAINNQDESQDKWNDGSTGSDNTYKTATEWNITNDDGYFVDIPVWLRSSAQTELTLSVDAYVTTTQAKDNDDLYCAARAVILYSDTAETSGSNNGGYAGAANSSSNLIRIKKDGFTIDGTTTKGNSIVDYMYSTNATGDAVSSTAGAYDNAIEYQGLQFLKVAAGANNTYGAMTKAVIRVWLEGEDPNCWNSNAGQDFAISLRFSKDNISAVEAKTNNNSIAITDSNKGTGTYATTAISHDGSGYGDSSTTDSLKAGARVWVKSTTNKPTGYDAAQTDLLQFEYNGDKWSLVSDGSFHKYEGFTYKLGDTDINSSDDIATYLKATIKTLANVQAHDTTAVGEPIEVTVTASGT